MGDMGKEREKKKNKVREREWKKDEMGSLVVGETPTMLSIKIDESLIFLILYVDDMLIDTKIT